MRSPLAVLAVLLAVAPVSAVPVAAQAEHWRDVPRPPLRAFEPQQPRRVELPNGLVVLLQENHELPLVQGSARIRGGAREEPADKAGLVGLYGQAWRTSGTRSRDGDSLDDFLEARAASVETGGGLDSTFVSFDCLTENLDDVFGVFVELLREPAFREDKLELAKDRLRTGIARRNDNPQGIAAREARKLAYGDASPYARQPEYATLAAIGLDDLTAWHRSTVHPNRIVLGFAGDFDPDAMQARIVEAFGGWPRGPEWQAPEAPAGPTRSGVFLVRKQDVNQSSISLVHLGARRDTPDFYALEVMNEVFGGGAAARLNLTIRTRKGLAYAVGGGVGAAFDHPGTFQVSMGTKSGTTAEAIDALYEEIDRLHQEPPTPAELGRAKDSILHSFVFRFDSKEKVLAEQALYEFYGYPPDFMARYRERIEAVTAEDVIRVARAYVRRADMALLVVGRPEDFDRPLSAFGEVTELDVSIPPPPGAAEGGGREASAPPAEDADSTAPASPEQEGRALLARVVEDLGGAERLSELSAVRLRGTLHASAPGGEREIGLTSLVTSEGALRQELDAPRGRLTLVVTPSEAFAVTPRGVQDLPDSRRDAVLAELRTAPSFVAAHADAPEVIVSAAGSETIGGVEARILEVNAFSATARWWVDPSTGRVLRTATPAPEGSGEQVSDLSDYRTVDGVRIPFRRELSRAGVPAGSVLVGSVEVDPEVAADAFARPKAAPQP